MGASAQVLLDISISCFLQNFGSHVLTFSHISYNKCFILTSRQSYCIFSRELYGKATCFIENLCLQLMLVFSNPSRNVATMFSLDIYHSQKNGLHEGVV